MEFGSLPTREAPRITSRGASHLSTQYLRRRVRSTHPAMLGQQLIEHVVPAVPGAPAAGELAGPSGSRARPRDVCSPGARHRHVERVDVDARQGAGSAPVDPDENARRVLLQFVQAE